MDKPKSQGRFVVVGSSTGAANRFIEFSGDLELTTVNPFSSDEDRISIGQSGGTPKIQVIQVKLDGVKSPAAGVSEQSSRRPRAYDRGEGDVGPVQFCSSAAVACM